MKFKELFYRKLRENAEASPEPSAINAPLFDLTLGGFPPDIYSKLSSHLTGADGENRAVALIYGAYGNQRQRLTVYKAVPVEEEGRSITEGDSVTPVRAHATARGRNELGGSFKLVQKTVASRDLFTDGKSFLDWTYRPTPVDQEYQKSKSNQRYQKMLVRIQNGEKIYRINANPSDRWYGKEVEYVEFLQRQIASHEKQLPVIQEAPENVFPVPARMYPQLGIVDGRRGGTYLAGKTDITGKIYAGGTIDAGFPGMKAKMDTSDDEVDMPAKQAGKKIVRSNLYRMVSHTKMPLWSWHQKPKNDNGSVKVVSVEIGKDHFYCMKAIFDCPIKLASYPDSKSEPRLRPTGYGSLKMGKSIGLLKTSQGRIHEVYDVIYVI